MNLLDEHRKELPPLNVARIIAVDPSGKLLIGQRANKDTFGGFWEFFGGTIDNGEDISTALCREFREETNLQIKSRHIKDFLVHEALLPDNRAIITTFYFIELNDTPTSTNITLDPNEHIRWMWIDREGDIPLRMTAASRIAALAWFRKKNNS